MADDTPPLRSTPPPPMDGIPPSSEQPQPHPPVQATTSVTVTSQTQDGESIQQYSTMDPKVALAHIELQKKMLDQELSIQNESWIKDYWRPMAAWLYMLICFMDFVGFPLLSMFLPEIMHHAGITASYVAWDPLTLKGGGMLHLAFGAILGVSAWQRGNEKVALINNGK